MIDRHSSRRSGYDDDHQSGTGSNHPTDRGGGRCRGPRRRSRCLRRAVQRYRRQLHVHCYRMLGSVDDADDLVQDTYLKAWQARASFEGRSLFRTWLYRIATNACLDALARRPKRVMPPDVRPPEQVLNTDFAPPVELPGSSRTPTGCWRCRLRRTTSRRSWSRRARRSSWHTSRQSSTCRRASGR